MGARRRGREGEGQGERRGGGLVGVLGARHGDGLLGGALPLLLRAAVLCCT
jgi:hypothetical protein